MLQQKIETNDYMLFLHDVIKFEGYLLSQNDVDIHIILKNFNEVENLNYSEIEAYWEIKIILEIILKYSKIVEHIFFICKKDKKLLKNKNFLNIKNIIEEKNKINFLNINSEQVALKLVIIWLLTTFNNKFISIFFDKNNEQWFNIFDITNNFIKIMNSFYAYFHKPAFSTLNEEIKSYNEFILYILMLLESENILNKKIVPKLELKQLFNKITVETIENVNTANNFVDIDEIYDITMIDEFDNFFIESNESENTNSNEIYDFNDKDNLINYLKKNINPDLEDKIKNDIIYRIDNQSDFVINAIKSLYKNKKIFEKKIKNKENQKKIFLEIKKKLLKNYIKLYVKIDNDIKNEKDKEFKQIFKFMSKKEGVKKTVFYKINYDTIKSKQIETSFGLNVNLNISFNKTKTLINKVWYSYNLHYLSINKIFKENKRNDKTFILKNFNVLNKIKNIQYFLDQNMYNIYYAKLCEYYKIDNKDPVNDLIKKYNINKIKIYSKLSQKENSEFYNLIIFFSLKKFSHLFKKCFYLSYFFDFRGRLYSYSSISPIGSRIFRYLYTYGKYATIDLKNFENSNINYNTEENYNYIIKNSIINDKYPNLISNEIIKKKVVNQILFEIGKIFKSDYIDKYQGKLSENHFIQIGVEWFNSYLLNNIKLDFEKEMEILYLLNILENYNNNNYIKNIIYKDATASALQLWMLILQSKDVINFEKCNLIESDYWHDTYYFIIDFFKKSNQIDNFSSKYFSRYFLKQAIMTFNYSATMYTVVNDFLKLIELSEKNFNISKKEKEILIEDIKKFYEFLKKFFSSNEFFYHSLKTLEEKIKNELDLVKNLEVELGDRCQVFLDYKKKEIKILDKVITNKETQEILRQKYSIFTVSEDIDEKKTLQSVKANFIHALDALLVRLILDELEYGIITIHDCFGIDVLNVSKLINIANDKINLIDYKINKINLNEKVHDIKFACKFILL